MKEISYVIQVANFDNLEDAIGIFETIIDRPPSIMKIQTNSKEQFQKIIVQTPSMSEEQMREKFQDRQLEVALSYLNINNK